MRRSLKVCHPLVTFLSPSPAVSRRASERLVQWTSLRQVNATFHNDDDDDTSSLRFAGISWDAVALQCQETGTVLQWIAAARSKRRRRRQTPSTPHSLLAIQNVNDKETDTTNDAVAAGLSVARKRLWQALQPTTSRPWVMLSSWLGLPVEAKLLLGSRMLPVLELSSSSNIDNSSNQHQQQQQRRCGLKELVIPFDPDVTYPRNEGDNNDNDNNNSRSIFTLLSRSDLFRPVTGLYQYDDVGGMCLRPLPTAKEDHILPPPSLVFHCTSLDKEIDVVEDDDSSSPSSSFTSVYKIGYTGRRDHGGQTMLRHDDLLGLDVRLCENQKYSSMFAEAQESLLAGSLEELQSSHVFQVAGSDKQDDDDDDDNNNNKDGDCWVEFRATLKNPSGFFQPSRRKRSAAKAPNLPYQ